MKNRITVSIEKDIDEYLEALMKKTGLNKSLVLSAIVKDNMDNDSPSIKKFVGF